MLKDLTTRDESMILMAARLELWNKTYARYMEGKDFRNEFARRYAKECAHAAVADFDEAWIK